MQLSERQWETLRAVADRLIPADEWPSASENGVMRYFECQFAGDMASTVLLYRVGIDAVDREAVLRYGAGFAELAARDQDLLLAALETGDVRAVWPIGARQFVDRLVDAVAEGYYADPEHNGGNPDKRSWAMMGFEERTGLAEGASGGPDGSERASDHIAEVPR